MVFEGECDENCEDHDKLDVFVVMEAIGAHEPTSSDDDSAIDMVPDDDQIDQNEHLFTCLGVITNTRACHQLVNQLAEHSTIHAITGSTPKMSPPPRDGSDVFISQSRYDDSEFRGILIETGASHASSAGYNQYLALNRDQPVEIDKAGAQNCRFRFGIGEMSSKGTITVSTPIGDIKFHVVDVDTSFLLPLQDLDAAGYYLNNLRNELQNGEGKKVPVVRLFGHPFLVWETSLASYFAASSVITFDIWLDEEEADNVGDADDDRQLSLRQLRQLHRRFGHPSANRLGALLRKSGHPFNQQAIDDLTHRCQMCQKHGGPPQRFKFTLRDDSLQFNHEVIVDIMYLDIGTGTAAPVIHIVDEATRFQAARFLKSMSAEHVWQTIRHCWIDTYAGPPDMIRHDAGTQFIAAEFIQQAKSMSIILNQVPVEAHHSIGAVERYHAPLRRAFQVIKEDLPNLTKEICLQMAVKAVNDTAGPDGLTPTLLVFGMYPRMIDGDPPHPSIADRAKTVKRTMSEVAKKLASIDVGEALRHRNGPRIDQTLDIPIGSQVLVWRERDRWTGPHQLLSIDGHTCHVQLPHGSTLFRVTSVKEFTANDEISEEGDQQAPAAAGLRPQRSGAPSGEDEGEGAGEDAGEPSSVRRPRRSAAARRQPAKFDETPAPHTKSRGSPQARNTNEANLDPQESNLDSNLDHQLDTQLDTQLESAVDILNDLAVAHITAKEEENLRLATKLRNDGVIRLTTPPFVDSRLKEINGLIDNGTFEIVEMSDVPNGVRIFNCRYVDEIKYLNGAPYEKSRLVIQAHNDDIKRMG